MCLTDKTCSKCSSDEESTQLPSEPDEGREDCVTYVKETIVTEDGARYVVYRFPDDGEFQRILEEARRLPVVVD